MRVRTLAASPAPTMAGTFVRLVACDKWRWNQSTRYTIKAAIAFYCEQHNVLRAKPSATSDNLGDNIIMYTFPDGSRLCVVKRDKTAWELNREGNRI